MTACETQCTSTQSAQIASDYVLALNQLILFDDLIDNHILPLLSCQIVTDFFTETEDILCVELV